MNPCKMCGGTGEVQIINAGTCGLMEANAGCPRCITVELGRAKLRERRLKRLVAAVLRSPQAGPALARTPQPGSESLWHALMRATGEQP